LYHRKLIPRPVTETVMIGDSPIKKLMDELAVLILGASSDNVVIKGPYAVPEGFDAIS